MQTLLEAVVARPSTTVAAAPILGQAHEALLLEQYSGPTKQWPTKSCIHNLFEFQAAGQSMAPCLLSPTARMSYGQVEARANQSAHMLQSMGVGPDVPVCILMERSVEAYVSMLGVMKAGGAYVPLVRPFLEVLQRHCAVCFEALICF